MLYLLLVLLAVNLALQAYDFWSTARILAGPDGRSGTADDGRELNRFMAAMMDKIGVVPTLTLTKVGSAAALAALVAGWYFSPQDPNTAWIIAGGLALVAAIYIRLFIKHNFKHDRL